MRSGAPLKIGRVELTEPTNTANSPSALAPLPLPRWLKLNFILGLFNRPHPAADQIMVHLQAALLLLLGVAFTEAHPHPTQNEEGCTCEAGARPFESYHIHVIFYPEDTSGGQFSNNTHSSQFARALRKRFVDRFDAPECDETRIFNLTDLCVFEVRSPEHFAPLCACVPVHASGLALIHLCAC